MKKIVTGLLALVFCLPSVSSAITTDELKAQIQALLSQIQELQTQLREQRPAASSTTPGMFPRAICRISAQRLAEGAEGGDVTSLQQFLGEQGYLSASSTGFFGPLTRRALARFQLEHGIIVSEGDGGEAGTRTMAYIMKKWCAARSEGPSEGPLGAPGTQPAEHTSVATPEPARERNAVVSIRSFSGPSNLDSGSSGTWTADATTTGPGPLRYRITWGDEAQGNAIEALARLADPASSFSDTPSFSHTYARAGSYTVSLLAQDAAGNAGRTSVFVRVGTPVSPVVETAVPSASGGSSGEGTHVVCPTDAKLCPGGTVLTRTGASCTFPACPLTQSAMELIGVTAPGAGAPRSGEIHCTYGGKTYSELQTYSAPVPCVEGTTGSVCGTKTYYCHFGAWYLKPAN